MTPSISTTLLWLGLLLTLLSGACCQSATVPVVTSMSGCADVGSTTVDCALPVHITVRGSGFNTNNITGAFTSNRWSTITVKLQLSPAAVAASLTSPTLSPSQYFVRNDTFFVFELFYLGKGALLEG